MCRFSLLSSEPFEIAVACQEKHGLRLRRVSEVAGTRAVHSYLTAQAFGLEDQASKCRRIFLVDDVGVIFQGPLSWRGNPDVHVMFWDKVLRGREDLARVMAIEIATQAGARGVFTAIPKSGRATIAFAQRVGFKILYDDGQAVMMEKLIT